MDTPLRHVKTNIVQSIRAHRVADLQQAAQHLGHHFLYANLSQSLSKQDVLDTITQQFMLAANSSKNFDSLYDGMTDPLHKSGQQPGFIVVLEHISRLHERGMPLQKAVLQGSRDIGFTVVAISVSLVAVFIPILFMGGVLGRLFHEFAVVMTAAILMSLLVSLTTTPMMCARLLPAHRPAETSKRARSKTLRGYRRSLAWTLRHPWLMWLLLLATVALNVTLYRAIPKGFFPQQDTGRVNGYIRADQSSSFQAMQQRLQQMLAIVQADPAVLNVTGFTGNSQRNAAQMFMTLKPRHERDASAEEVVRRLRAKLSKEAGARLFMTPVQDLRFGARASDSPFEYTIKADELAELRREHFGFIFQRYHLLPHLDAGGSAGR